MINITNCPICNNPINYLDDNHRSCLYKSFIIINNNKKFTHECDVSNHVFATIRLKPQDSTDQIVFLFI
jgi:hypothetical protein